MKELSAEQLERIERALDQRLSPEEWEAFQAEVVAVAHLREAYVERAWLQGQMRADRDFLEDLLREDEAPASSAEVISPRFSWVWGAGIAAVLALMFTLLMGPEPQHTVAILEEAQNCKWAGSDLPTVEGAELQQGTLALVEGMATLRFKSGATVTLEAPTTLEVLSDMRCRLIEGSVVADVPDSAHGFTIDTSDLEVVDLGTRFGLTAAGVGRSQLCVFEGEVEVSGEGHEEPKRYKAGRGIVIGREDAGATAEPSRDLSPTIEEEGWRAISTNFRNGKDSFVRWHTDKPAGHDPLVMVKHTDLVDSNVRHGYLSFDLGRMNLQRIARAELVLDLQPSGLGFSALVPDSRFIVYGLTDESLDSWDESQMNWNNAPAKGEGAQINPENTRKLAEFVVRRGAPSGRQIISGEGIAEFLREDSNGIVTLVLVRETGETDSQGLVHAFASKEHPSALPPTLRIQTHDQ